VLLDCLWFVTVVTEEHVGSHSPCTFESRKEVYLQDFWLIKWVYASIVSELGPLAYKINVDGHPRQVHLDHLKPKSHSVKNLYLPIVHLVVMLPTLYYLVMVDEEESEEVMDTIPSANSLLYPQRDRRPPR